MLLAHISDTHFRSRREKLYRFMYLIPGNHDDKAHFLEHLHPLCPQLGNDPQNMRYAVDDFATRL
ncbi:phosphodiesterase, partial [Klebsiella pneumoniae]